jgi:ketosteroid isomerase-like protein
MYRLSRTMVVLLGVATLAPHAGFSQSSGQNSQEAAIRSVIQAQIDAWNRHDLEAFMAGYWNSPNLTFFSGATETQGWQPTLERYRKKYQSAGTEMGKLEFQDLQIEMLGTGSAFVRGKFQLMLSNGKQPYGVFTLIFRQFPDGWRIIHDHTSGE